MRLGPVAPRIGEHTRELLLDAGLDEAHRAPDLGANGRNPILAPAPGRSLDAGRRDVCADAESSRSRDSIETGPCRPRNSVTDEQPMNSSRVPSTRMIRTLGQTDHVDLRMEAGEFGESPLARLTVEPGGASFHVVRVDLKGNQIERSR